MSNQSSSSIPIQIPKAVYLSEYKTGRVLQTELFEIYVARLVRKHIACQFVGTDHPVLIDEQKMVDSAASNIRSYLEHSVPEWKTSWRMTKLIVIYHIRQMAEQRLALHDVDDEAREIALEFIYKEDYEELFHGIRSNDYSS